MNFDHTFNIFLGNLQEYLNGLYKDARQYDLVAFWKDVCRDFAVKELLLSSQLLEKPGCSYRKSRKSDPTEHSLALSGSERLGALMKRVGEETGKMIFFSLDVSIRGIGRSGRV